MKRVITPVCIGLVLGLLFCASTLIAAEISFKAERVATAEELRAIANLPDVAARVTAIDLDGQLLVWVDALDFNKGMAPGALLRLDVSKRPVTGSVLVLEMGPGGLNEAQAKPTGDVDLWTGMVVASDGTIYVGDFDGDDEILAIHRSDLDTVTKVESFLQAPGIMGLGLVTGPEVMDLGLGVPYEGDETIETLWWVEEAGWYCQDSIQEGRPPIEGLLGYVLPDGPGLVLVPPDYIQRATNNAKGPGMEVLAVAPDGRFALALDLKYRTPNAPYYGTDQLIRLIPYPPGCEMGAHRAPVVDIPYSYEFFGGKFPGLHALTIDENGVIYGWNLPGGAFGVTPQLEVIKGRERYVITEDEIVEKAGIKPGKWGTLEFWRASLCVDAEDDGSVVLYGANQMGGDIIKIAFPPGTSSKVELFE